MISIIMTAYNSAAYIKEAIESVVAQTFHDGELIIVDDASIDATAEIIKSFQDPRIKLIESTHQGHAMSKKIAFSHCSGEYITFFDSDDVMQKQLLETLYTLCVSTHSDCAACKHWVWDENINRNYTYNEPAVPRFYMKDRIQVMFMKRSRCALWTKLFHKRCFDGFIFPTTDPCSDVPTCYALLAKANKVVFIDRKMLGYRRRADSMTSRRRTDTVNYMNVRNRLGCDVLNAASVDFPVSRWGYINFCCDEIAKAKKRGYYDALDKDIIETLQKISQVN